MNEDTSGFTNSLGQTIEEAKANAEAAYQAKIDKINQDALDALAIDALAQGPMPVEVESLKRLADGLTELIAAYGASHVLGDAYIACKSIVSQFRAEWQRFSKREIMIQMARFDAVAVVFSKYQEHTKDNNPVLGYNGQVVTELINIQIAAHYPARWASAFTAAAYKLQSKKPAAFPKTFDAVEGMFAEVCQEMSLK